MQTAKTVSDALLFPGAIRKGDAYKRLFQDLYASPSEGLAAHMDNVLETWMSVVRAKGPRASVDGLYLASDLLHSLAKTIPEDFGVQIDRTNEIQAVMRQFIDSKALPRRLPQRLPGMNRGCMILQSSNARHQFLTKMAPAFAAIGFEVHEYVFGQALPEVSGNSFVLLVDDASQHAIGSLYIADSKTLLVFNTWTMGDAFMTYVVDTMVLALPINFVFFFPNQIPGFVNLQEKDIERFGMGQCIDWAVLLAYLAGSSIARTGYSPEIDISPQMAVLYESLKNMSLQQLNALQAEIGFFGGKKRLTKRRRSQCSPNRACP